MPDPKFLNFFERKKLGGKFDLPGEKMTRFVLSRLSPPRSSMSSAGRPVPMPRTSTTTSTTTSTPTSTTTPNSPRSSLTSPSLVFSSQSRSSPLRRTCNKHIFDKWKFQVALIFWVSAPAHIFNIFDGTIQCHEIIEKSFVCYIWFEYAFLRWKSLMYGKNHTCVGKTTVN